MLLNDSSKVIIFSDLQEIITTKGTRPVFAAFQRLYARPFNGQFCAAAVSE
jgi:hypothetical protein